jgi:hypothetical protein
VVTTSAITLHLGGHLHHPRNLLFRYVASQIRRPSARVALAESKHKWAWALPTTRTVDRLIQIRAALTAASLPQTSSQYYKSSSTVPLSTNCAGSYRLRVLVIQRIAYRNPITPRPNLKSPIHFVLSHVPLMTVSTTGS